MGKPKKSNNKKTVRQKYFKDGSSFQPVWLGKDILENYLTVINDGQNLYYYEKGVYKKGGESRIKKLATNLLGDEFRRDRVNQAIDWITNKTIVTNLKLNPNDGLINVKNGLLNYKTGELLPHDPKRLSTIQLPVEYNPKSNAKQVSEFVNNVIPEDTINTLYEIIGYCLVPHTWYEKAFFFIGSGANGKSTLINMVSAMLGRENVTNITLHDLENNRFKLAELQGKLLNTFADLPRKSLSNASNFKSIVSGDSINAERKNKDPFDFRPFAKLIFSTNELPRSSDVTEGFFRRIIIIPFTKKFKPGQADPKLGEKLSTPEALSTLLNLAIKGLKLLEENGTFTESETMENCLKLYRYENNNINLFVSECCELIGDEVGTQTKKLYEAYNQWCKSSGYFPLGKGNFNKQLAMTFNLTKTRIKDEPCERWVGIALLNDF